MTEVVTLATPDLGDRTYLVVAAGAALVVDPQRDIDRILTEAESRGVEILHVLETHIHNDFVSGGLELAREADADYVVNRNDPVEFERTPVSDGDRFSSGDMTVSVIHTPGHTPTHLSYAIETEGSDWPAVFTGGSLLYGSVGRPDLLGPEYTDGLARAQFHSARRLVELPVATEVFPTHGFGSFCSSGDISEAEASTIGGELAGNVVFRIGDEDEFVRQLLDDLTPYPRYYAHTGPANLAGPAAIDLTPPRGIDAEGIRHRVEAGEWVVDIRQRRAFAVAHAEGTIGIEGGDSFLTYLGWLIPWGTPVTLLADSPQQIGDAQRSLTRIGIDRPAAAASGGPAAWGSEDPASYPVVDFLELHNVFGTDGTSVLDVRRADEWQDGHIGGASNLPIHELPDRLGELPNATFYVYCETGYRASVACSLLDRAGRSAVLVDDEFANAARVGLPIATGP